MFIFFIFFTFLLLLLNSTFRSYLWLKRAGIFASTSATPLIAARVGAPDLPHPIWTCVTPAGGVGLPYWRRNDINTHTHIYIRIQRGREGIREYPDVGAADPNQDATRIPRGHRTNTTGVPLGCPPRPATSELHVSLGRELDRATSRAVRRTCTRLHPDKRDSCNAQWCLLWLYPEPNRNMGADHGKVGCSGVGSCFHATSTS